MRQSVPRGNKKSTVQPVTIITNTAFKPKISERTIRKRKANKERQLNPGRYASGLDLCGTVCLYMFLVLSIIIGGGGIAFCAIYFNTDSTTQGWKIGGIVLGALTCAIGVILILLTIFKQSRNRPWEYKKKEELVKNDDYYIDDYDDEMKIDEDDDVDEIQDNIIISRDNQEDLNNVSPSAITRFPFETQTREIATSPLPDTSNAPSQYKTLSNDLIFCPGCNRSHPSAHQCMYAPHTANTFAPSMRSMSYPIAQDSIGIQTERPDKIKQKTIPHTVIDRTLKYSNTTETQTNVTAKPSSNATESIIVRRVPIPTAKVVVQQPTTKVMIVKVPNIAGQLIIQPKTTSNDEQPK